MVTMQAVKTLPPHLDRAGACWVNFHCRILQDIAGFRKRSHGYREVAYTARVKNT